VLRILRGMPPGTVGVEATGKVTDEDYRNVLAPALADGLQDRNLRLLYVLGDGHDGHSPGAAWEDTKLWSKHLRDWKRVAIVSDEDWLENAVKAFSWLMPGEVRVFETDDVREAKGWLVGIEPDDD
jgi:SpoIIAA-like